MTRRARNEDPGAPPPEAGPQAGGDQRRPRPGYQRWPRLSLKGQGPQRGKKGTGGHTWRGPPATSSYSNAALVGLSQHSPPPLLLPRATSTFRSNVAVATPPSRLSDASGSDALPRPPRRAAGHGTSGSDGGGGDSLPRRARPREVKDRFSEVACGGDQDDAKKNPAGRSCLAEEGPRPAGTPRSTGPVKRQQPPRHCQRDQPPKIGLQGPYCNNCNCDWALKIAYLVLRHCLLRLL